MAGAIQSEEEYLAALAELRRDLRAAREQARLLAEFGLTPDDVDRAMAPLRELTERLRRRIDRYERSRR